MPNDNRNPTCAHVLRKLHFRSTARFRPRLRAATKVLRSPVSVACTYPNCSCVAIEPTKQNRPKPVKAPVYRRK